MRARIRSGATGDSSAPLPDSALVLTVDIGSSSVRTNLFTERAVRLEEASTRIPCEPRTTPDGGVELDPELLLEQVFTAIDRTLHRAGRMAGQISGVGMCSLVSNVLGVDRNYRPTTPIYTWADTRGAVEAEELRAALDEEEVHDRTGCYFHPSYLPARLLWLRRTQPRAYARTVRWISLGELVTLRLFGQIGQSLSVASWGGLLNRHTLDWDERLLAVLDVSREQLPPLVDINDPFSGLRSEYAGRWPALRDVRWFPCVGDGATGSVGSGCYSPDCVAVQVGTSSAMRVLVPGTPPPDAVPRGLWCYRLDRQTSLVGGALSEGGNVLDWLGALLAAPGGQALAEEAAGLAADSHGLTILPFVAGERSPGWDSTARAAITGLSLDTRPAQVFRAAQEAVTYRLGMVYDLLASCGWLPQARLVVGSGGALLNVPGWLQMLADVLGRPVTASGEPEASSRGAAMIALRACGIIAGFSAIPPLLGPTYRPSMRRHAVYRRAMQRQTALYRRLAMRSLQEAEGGGYGGA